MAGRALLAYVLIALLALTVAGLIVRHRQRKRREADNRHRIEI